MFGNDTRIESKIYIYKNCEKVVVAEVVSNCGCGFNCLIRIHPDYKHSLPIFATCMELCNIPMNEINIDKQYVEKCYDRGYLIQDESIAVVLDKII